jgi:hypothetical protein
MSEPGFVTRARLQPGRNSRQRGAGFSLCGKIFERAGIVLPRRTIVGERGPAFVSASPNFVEKLPLVLCAYVDTYQGVKRGTQPLGPNVGFLKTR